MLHSFRMPAMLLYHAFAPARLRFGDEDHRLLHFAHREARQVHFKRFFTHRRRYADTPNKIMPRAARPVAGSARPRELPPPGRKMVAAQRNR